MRREGLPRTLLSCPTCCASHRLIRMAPSSTCLRMRSGWRHILRISLAIAAETPGRLHALFKAYETAIRAAATPATIVRAPGIVLGLGATANSQDTDTNSQDEQREPHGRLLMAPPINAHRPGQYARLASSLHPLPISTVTTNKRKDPKQNFNWQALLRRPHVKSCPGPLVRWRWPPRRS